MRRNAWPPFGAGVLLSTAIASALGLLVGSAQAEAPRNDAPLGPVPASEEPEGRVPTARSPRGPSPTTGEEPIRASTTLEWPLPQAVDRTAEARDASRSSSDPDDPLESYYTAPLAPVVVGLRVVPSFGLRIDDSVGPSFVLEVAAVLKAPLHRGYSYWALWPELGYAAVVPGGAIGQELGVGLGVGRVFEEVAALRWTPWLVADVSNGEQLGIGLRNRAAASLYDIVSLELSQQWLAFDGGSRHDVRLGVGLDVLVLLTRAALGEGLEP